MGPKIILATQIDGFLYYSNFEFLFEDVKNLIKRQATSKSIQTATKILIAKRTNDFLVLTEERKVSEKWKYVRGAPVRSIKDATPFSTHYISMAESLRAVLHAKLNDIRKRKKVMGKSADDIINQLFAP